MDEIITRTIVLSKEKEKQVLEELSKKYGRKVKLVKVFAYILQKSYNKKDIIKGYNKRIQ